MYQDMKILALIPARGGSKSLPGKNIKNLAGRPLIAYSIGAALEARSIDRVIVSTDHEEIARVARDNGADVPFMRPSELAADDSPTHDAILHALDWLAKHKNQHYDLLCLLQPTSPFRTAAHIDEAVERFANHANADLLLGVSPLEKNPTVIRKVDDQGYLESLIPIENAHLPRQAFSRYYILNGALYIARCRDIIRQKRLPVRNHIPYPMGHVESLDIDTETDLLFAEYLMARKNFLKASKIMD